MQRRTALRSICQKKSTGDKDGAISAIFIGMFRIKIESKCVCYVGTFICHLAHDGKNLFIVRGKLAVSKDLSSNLSHTLKKARLESTRKINLKFDLHKNTASVEKQLCFHLVSVSASQNNHSKILKHFPIAQCLSTTRNQCVSRFVVS